MKVLPAFLKLRVKSLTCEMGLKKRMGHDYLYMYSDQNCTVTSIITNLAPYN